MSVEKPRETPYLISSNFETLNLIVGTTSNQIRVLHDGDMFMEHNGFLYIKTADGIIKSFQDYFPQRLNHRSIASSVQAAQLNAHEKLTRVN